MDDEQLIARTRRGELEAYSQLVARHRPEVHRIAARIVGPDDADDVTQDTFLRAFNALDRFRGDASFRTWVLRIAHNTAINTLAKRRAIPVDEVPEPAGDSAPKVRSPADLLESGERQERLLHKIGLLRHDYQVVVVLRDVEELDYNEIADILDCPIGTVKTRLHRARALLIDMLRNNTYDWELPA
ncbi:ECF RNA polymerase sigma-E factor [Paraconexibacter sp. AEG42_29]|uniref:ECF RNA polymerase sigma-E factor n=1 Tax=Paraconexibacter sp. AEG42_29 TaxID=2997339 RepID=A0AAU7APR7_9ACTN